MGGRKMEEEIWPFSFISNGVRIFLWIHLSELRGYGLATDGPIHS
jgi:hypothetical protein